MRFLLGLSMIVVSAPMLAQEGASLSLTVHDERGRPIESAAVILRPELSVPVELPPPFFTDANGQVLIEGLMEGEWQVEVRSQGFMIFSAYVKLQEGLPPAVGFKSKQRTGTFWAPIEVYFKDVDVDFSAAARGRKGLEKTQRRSLKQSEKAGKREDKQQAQRAKDAEKAERMAAKRRARLGRGAEVASLEERPTDVGERPKEAAVRATAPAVSAEPQVVPPLEPTVVAAVEPEPAVPESDLVRAPPPEPPPPPPTPAVPDIQAQPFLFRGGACPECKRGEWALVVERRAAVSVSSTAVCGEGREEKVEKIIDQVLRPQAGALGSYAGPLIDAHGNGVVAHLGEEIALQAYQEVAADGPCQDFVAILPREARFVGFRLEAVDADSQGDCFGTEVCSIGEARWVELPQIERTATLTVIHASFLNESKGRERRGRFIVLFVPPAGWQAP